MSEDSLPLSKSLSKDLPASLVVFLVALPLCLGIALASDAPLMSGLIAGVVGGIVVGSLSGSHISVSGPAAGLTAVVAAQIAMLGSFEAFLAAVVVAGGLQLLLGVLRAGFISTFFPGSVIKGLLAAIGVILILKQIPHLLGHDADAMGEMSYRQPDDMTTFSELWFSITHFQISGAVVVGFLCLALLLFWDRSFLKKCPVPSALVVVLLGGLVSWLLRGFGGLWVIDGNHLVQVPQAESQAEMLALLTSPDWSAFARKEVYVAAFTIAIVASLETLLNIEAADNLDPQQRTTPPNRELLAQGAGNVCCGLLGGLPVTSVIIRSSVNANTGARTKLSAILHGFLLIGCILLIPGVLNLIPLSALAAILLVTGFKLASPKLVRQMWSEGWAQFLPFLITVLVIVFTDLLVGIIVGLAVALGFILWSNYRRPVKQVIETHVWGDVLRIELANQVSFLNRPALERSINSVPAGGHVLLDATHCDYIDPDIVDLIHDFKHKVAPAHEVTLSLKGFRDHYSLEEQIEYVDYTSREVQEQMAPDEVLKVLADGNRRFLTGARLDRDFKRQIDRTADGQHPVAVILSCIDSRAPVEHIFDLGLGDVFTVRIAGNVAREKVMASMEYGCVVAGSRLVLVLGHTSCGAVTAAVDLFGHPDDPAELTGCDHISALVNYLQESVDPAEHEKVLASRDAEQKSDYVNRVAKENVLRTIERIRAESRALRQHEVTGKIRIVGGMYDIRNGQVEFFASEKGRAVPLLPGASPSGE